MAVQVPASATSKPHAYLATASGQSLASKGHQWSLVFFEVACRGGPTCAAGTVPTATAQTGAGRSRIAAKPRRKWDTAGAANGRGLGAHTCEAPAQPANRRPLHRDGSGTRRAHTLSPPTAPKRKTRVAAMCERSERGGAKRSKSLCATSCGGAGRASAATQQRATGRGLCRIELQVRSVVAGCSP